MTRPLYVHMWQGTMCLLKYVGFRFVPHLALYGRVFLVARQLEID